MGPQTSIDYQVDSIYYTTLHVALIEPQLNTQNQFKLVTMIQFHFIIVKKVRSHLTDIFAVFKVHGVNHLIGKICFLILSFSLLHQKSNVINKKKTIIKK